MTTVPRKAHMIKYIDFRQLEAIVRDAHKIKKKTLTFTNLFYETDIHKPKLVPEAVVKLVLSQLIGKFYKGQNAHNHATYNN